MGKLINKKTDKKVNRITKTRRIELPIIIGAFMLLLCACNNKNSSGVTETSSIVESTEQESASKYTKEQENAWKQQIQSGVETLTMISNDIAQLDAFADYLIESNDIEQLSGLTYDETISSQLHQITGKSLIVLWDEFTGKLKDASTAEGYGIYVKNQDNLESNEQATENTNAVLAFAGDLCLTEDGFVIDHYDEQGGVLNSCISQSIIDVTNQADIFMLNHEYPVSNRGTALEGKYYTFRGAPERDKILQELGTDIVSLANNHIYDYGADALYDTMDTLKSDGIPYVGAGRNIEEAARPVYYVVNGIKIGFASANRSEKIIYTPEAGVDSPGVVRMYDTTMMNEMIQKASKECDYLVAYVHWGTEDSPYYEEYEREIAREFIHSGADAIIGGHPHVLQGMEYLEGKPVVYSLGDFWFNSETKFTTIVSLNINIDGLQQMKLLPCRQENFETHDLTNTPDSLDFMEHMRALSPNVNIDDAGFVNAVN